MSTGVALAVSVVLLVLNGFFVAAEFAIVAAKRHRLEERAAEGSRPARAALLESVASNSNSKLIAGGDYRANSAAGKTAPVAFYA